MNNLQKAFRKMRADVKVIEGDPVRGDYSVDVKNGKFIFNLGDSKASVTVQHADTTDKHVLINIRREVEETTRSGKDTKKKILNEKWLCGHDERDWFVASAKGTNIWEAKQSLKPDTVKAAELVVPVKKRQKRKNAAFKRQGEWFFVPVPEGRIPSNVVIFKDEPISRGGGSKPHIVEEVTRRGGEVVYVLGNNILNAEEYNNLPDDERNRPWRSRMANATVFGRGYVKHKDHETIHLDGWHEILMNTEDTRSNRPQLLFLD